MEENQWMELPENILDTFGGVYPNKKDRDGLCKSCRRI